MDVFLTTMIVTLVVALVTQLAKKIKFINGLGDYGIQLLVLVFAILIALLEFGFTFIPTQWAEAIITVWGGAITWYELVLKKFTSKG